MCMTSSIPNSIVMAIVVRYPKLRYIRNGHAFCKEFFKQSYRSFLNEETLEKLSAVAVGFTWEQANSDAGTATVEKVVAAFSQKAC